MTEACPALAWITDWSVLASPASAEYQTILQGRTKEHVSKRKGARRISLGTLGQRPAGRWEQWPVARRFPPRKSRQARWESNRTLTGEADGSVQHLAPCMAEMRDHKDMPDTGERREITARVNAKEVETVQQSQKLVSKTKQLSASRDAKSQVRSARSVKGRPRQRTA